ncbi:MAG: response regulator, partial [Candidatus Pacebacteria bacterium]|nr:response regulator [Candidatus Paceibacterota bacterium]
MNKKILVVEDDIVLRDVLKEKLAQKGYAVFAVEDGEQALRHIADDKPDLILLDILMPRKGGMEVMEELNQDEEFKQIPIIVISNSGQPVEVQRAKDLGAKEFLIKAVFDPNEVLEKVEKVLNETSM